MRDAGLGSLCQSLGGKGAAVAQGCNSGPSAQACGSPSKWSTRSKQSFRSLSGQVVLINVLFLNDVSGSKRDTGVGEDSYVVVFTRVARPTALM